MKDTILMELAARWKHEAKAPECEDGGTQAVINNAIGKGARDAKRECAEKLEALVNILGDAV